MAGLYGVTLSNIRNLNSFHTKDLHVSEERGQGWPGNTERAIPLLSLRWVTSHSSKISPQHLHVSSRPPPPPPFFGFQAMLHSVFLTAAPLLEHKTGETIVSWNKRGSPLNQPPKVFCYIWKFSVWLLLVVVGKCTDGLVPIHILKIASCCGRVFTLVYPANQWSSLSTFLLGWAFFLARCSLKGTVLVSHLLVRARDHRSECVSPNGKWYCTSLL